MKIIKKFKTNIEKKKLYEAWTSEELLIPPVIGIECEREVGGKLVLYSEEDGKERKMIGKFKEIIPNEKLVYTSKWDDSDEETLISVEFNGSSHTELVIEQEGFLTPESRDKQAYAWDDYVDELEELLDN